MSCVLTVATRAGALALAQTHIVIEMLKARCRDLDIRIKEVTSEGDRDRDTVLWNLKETGFFTSRLEEMLLEGKADFAVHSYKDLPTKSTGMLAITAVCHRHFPEDCLLAKKPIHSIRELPPKARIGTASLRRTAQLRYMRSDIEVVPIRGNVQTRIAKLDTDDLDGIVLARAGLERLGLADKIAMTFDPQIFISAPAQGALAIQARTGDGAINKILASIDDPIDRAVTDAEREVLVKMRCGCHAPVGAYAQCTGSKIVVDAFVADARGERLLTTQATGPISEASAVGASAAVKLLDAGGRRILDDLESQRDRENVDA